VTVSRRRLLLVALAAAACGCRQAAVVTDSFATLAEARTSPSGAATVPEWLPESARDIRTARLADSTGQWGLFEFSPSDTGRMRAALQTDETSLSGLRCGIPGRIEWWPVILREPIDGDQARAAALQAYRTLDARFIVAVNWKQGRAYYWNEYGAR
jgi:hypothetical protein